MTRDIQDRLELFAGFPVEVKRLALNMPQVEEFDPPPNPAKLTDSRAIGYIDKFGKHSWELDALNPEILRGIIEGEVKRLIDSSAWDAVMLLEGKGERQILEYANHAASREAST